MGVTLVAPSARHSLIRRLGSALLAVIVLLLLVPAAPSAAQPAEASRPYDYSLEERQGTRFEVEDRNGNVIYERRPDGRRAVSVQTARMITQTLEGNVRSGTGTRARISTGMAAGGKTGTPDEEPAAS